MASTTDITDLVEASATPGNVGWVTACRRASRDDLRLTEDLKPIMRPEREAGPAHPRDAQPAREAERDLRREPASGSGGPEVKQELSAADLVWLQRLPQDATQVTHDDAARVAGLAARAGKLTPSSRHLVESIWKPIEEFHDRREAEHQARVASTNPVSLPATVERALIKAVAAEHPDWPDVAVNAHAAELMADATARRDAVLESRRRQARDRLAKLDDKTTSRLSVTRGAA